MAIVTQLSVREIQLALHHSVFINAMQDVICPNVSWGLLPYEADLIAVSPHGVCTEFEIKRSFEDFKADFKKGHKHDAPIIGIFYYVIPLCLQDKVVAFLKERYVFMNYPAVLTYDEQGHIAQVLNDEGKPFGNAVRKNAAKLSVIDRAKLARLISLRYWDLRHFMNSYESRFDENDKWHTEQHRKDAKRIKTFEHSIYDKWQKTDNCYPANKRVVLARSWSGNLFLAWCDKGVWNTETRHDIWVQWWIDVPCYTNGETPYINLY